MGDSRTRSGHGRPPNDPHWLAAVPWHLELTQPRDAELRSALSAHQEDVEILDVFYPGWLARPRSDTRGGAQRGEPDPGDHHADEHGRQDDPDAHEPSVRT